MFKELKMKIAARRVERKKAREQAAKKANKSKKASESFWTKLWKVICKPFNVIGRWLKNLWAWVRSIDLIGLVNITLLSSIIVLFSMLIIDVIGCNKKPVVIIAKNDIEAVVKPQITVSEKPAPIKPKTEPVTLPIKKDPETHKFVKKPIVKNVCGAECKIVQQQTARVRNVMYGDIIVDSRGAASMLKSGDTVKGNLYLQNMRKYILPCDMRIEGNLFLRDVNMLQFCGDFTVTGNIYVSPRSSFGPIPKTARLGGQVIL